MANQCRKFLKLIKEFPKRELTHSSHFEFGENFVVDIFGEPGFQLLKGIFERKFLVELNKNLIFG